MEKEGGGAGEGWEDVRGDMGEECRRKNKV